MRDPGEYGRLVVRLRHVLNHTATVEFPSPWLAEFGVAFHQRAIVKAVQQSRLLRASGSGLTTPLSIRIVKPTSLARDPTGVLNRTAPIGMQFCTRTFRTTYH